MARRSKQIQTLIDNTNQYLKANKITNQYNDVAHFVMYSLIMQRLYEGFNWYHTIEFQGEYVDTVCKEEDAEFIQIY